MRSANTSETKVFELKPLAKEGIDSSIEKAERYRLLNQPHLAESICLDILLVSPDHQKASTILLLALTDQFDSSSSKAKQALAIARGLKDEYSRIYYSGIIAERRGAVALKSRAPGSDFQDRNSLPAECVKYPHPRNGPFLLERRVSGRKFVIAVVPWRNPA